MNEVVAFGIMLVIAHIGLMLLFSTSSKSTSVSRWFFLPSLLFVWIGYAAYEGIYIRRHCPGDCSIRVDMLFIGPYLAVVTICSLVYFVRAPDRGRSSADR